MSARGNLGREISSFRAGLALLALVGWVGGAPTTTGSAATGDAARGKATVIAATASLADTGDSVGGATASGGAAVAPPPGASEWDGTWRVVMGVVAPWVPAGLARPDARRWIGTEVVFAGPRVTGLGALDCEDAEFELVPVPPEGLFQGNLPVPAVRAAESLGIRMSREIRDAEGVRTSTARHPTHELATSETSNAASVPTLRLTASSGLFDFHRPDGSTLLVALDDVIWTLGRSAGTSAHPDSPAGIVERWLEAHFAGDLGFRPSTVQAGRELLTPELQDGINAYFRDYLPKVPADEVPLIDGDPFTDSQEYPTRFEVQAAVPGDGGPAPGAAGDESRVSVIYRDAFVEGEVTFVLRPVDGHWRIDDVAYGEGEETLRSLLLAVLRP